jgi:hypothetical protein
MPPGINGFTVAEQIFVCGGGGLFCDNYVTGGGTLRDVPVFVEVGEAGIAVHDAMRRQRRVQLVG